jgi:hypothetical protein
MWVRDWAQQEDKEGSIEACQLDIEARQGSPRPCSWTMLKGGPILTLLRLVEDSPISGGALRPQLVQRVGGI